MEDPNTPMDASLLLPIIPLAGIIAILFAIYLARDVLARDTGTPEMQAVAGTIMEGAVAFIRRQYTTIGVIALFGAVVIGVVITLVETPAVADVPKLAGLPIGVMTAFAFLVGAACSMASGIIGMFVAVKSNVRTASAARRSLVEAVQVAMRGGAVSGFLVVSLSLLGVWGIFTLYDVVVADVTVAEAPFLIVGFGFGASFVALFAQLGGGIYTKAADVGSDLVGKVEAGIPEDDPRNAGVIADLVGDNVGDCAGRGADLFESTAAENIGAMVLGASLATAAEKAGMGFSAGIVGVMLFPLVARAFGILASIVGVLFVKMKSETEDPMHALNRGYYVTAVLAIIGFGLATWWLLASAHNPDAWWKYFLCGMIGVVTSIAFVFITQYYTEYKYRPVREIAEASQTGPATNIIAGISVGFECTLSSVIAISIAIISSYMLGNWAFPTPAGMSWTAGGGLFGTGVATMGMLATAGYILAMDNFGPITDNAGGIVEMSEQPEEIRKRTDRLDAVGNTTKALTKGYAIGSAALAAFLLFSAYLDEVRNFMGDGIGLKAVNVSNPMIFVAGLLGATLVFYFTSLAIKAVGRSAYAVIEAVRKQFKEHPGILQGTEKPNYRECVDLVTKSALREMVKPGLWAVCMPIAVGLIFKQFTSGAEAVAAFLIVGTIAGVLMATFLNNAGGAWDNAKKYIESGLFTVDGKVVGKRSEPHKAAVVGDTVGDPFKDTAGPSLHVLIKLLSTVTLVLAPLFI